MEARKEQWLEDWKLQQIHEEWERQGIWDPTLTGAEARRNAINLSVGLALPQFIKAGTAAVNNRALVNVAPKVIGTSTDEFLRVLTPKPGVDAIKILHRGTTGSETGSNLLILTDDVTVAATYVKNGGQVMSFHVSEFGLKALEFSGHLTKSTGSHGTLGKLSTEYWFETKELVNALMKLAEPH